MSLDVAAPLAGSPFLLIALMVFSNATTAQPRDTVRIEAGSGSRVWIEGSSNVHDWSCKAKAFDAQVDVQRDQEGNTNGSISIRRVKVVVSARDLKCGNGRMDRDLYSALKATDPDSPSYIVATFDALTGSPDTGTIETSGTILVAGVHRDVAIRISTERLRDGRIRATGGVPLRMTEFGVKPPVGLLGLIRARNEIVVRFELVVDGREPAP